VALSLISFLIFISILLFFPSLYSQVEAFDTSQKKWDFGLFMGRFQLPDYPGASQSRVRHLALPYAVYRGEVIRNDGGGLRGRFLNSDRFELSLSISAAFPSDSEDNVAREGMEDLDWIGQVGPQLIVHLNKSPIAQLDLLVPLRFVFSTDLKNLNSRGGVFQPEFRLRHTSFFDPKLFFLIFAGPTFASESLQDYFYEVSTVESTSVRGAFDAKAGYMSFQSTLAASRAVTEKVRVFLGIGKNYFSGARNRQSPLMRDTETESYVAGLLWSLY